MSPHLTDIPSVFSEPEQYHAKLAWELGRGARYTPDPRQTRSGSLLLPTSKVPIFSGRQKEGLYVEGLLPEMIQCHPR